MLWGFDGTIRRLIAGGRDNEAAALLREKIRLCPRPRSRYLNYLGVCETRLGHLELAHELFTQTLLLSPRDSRALNNLGNLAYIKKDDGTAREYYMRSLRENVWATEPRHNLTVLYQDLGHSEKALSAYEGYMTMLKAIRWAKIAGTSLLVLLMTLILRI